MLYYKTPGNFFHEGVSYEKDYVFSEDDVTALGIDITSLVPANEQEKVAQDAAKAAPEADADAELDTETAPEADGEKKDNTDTTDQSAPANGSDAPKTVGHTVTQEDLDKNPQLVTDGVQVGEEIEIPAIEKVVDQAWLDANPDIKKPDDSSFAIGDTILVADEAGEG